MIATIVSTTRGSKNNLKDNFIGYKRQQNTKINWIELDKDQSEDGLRLFLSMKDELAQDEINDILSAKTFNQFEFIRFRSLLNRNNQEAEHSDLLRFYRTHIELFYGEAANEALLQKDRKGKLRDNIKWLAKLVRNPVFTDDDISIINDNTSRKSAKIKMETLEDHRYAAILLSGLLSLTPIYNNGKFDTSIIFTTDDLKEFAKRSKDMRKFVEEQLGISTRKDILEKPVMHLWALLKLVGLTKDMGTKATKIKGEKVYQYKICEDTYNELFEIVDRRRSNGPYEDETSEKVGWKFINKLYGFEYTDAELDYIAQY